MVILSFVRGCHTYQTVWDPKVGIVLRLEREPTNSKDRNAVSVMDPRERKVVGHIPFNLAPIVSNVLRRSVNKGTVEVTGQQVNRGTAHVVQALWCTEACIDKLRKIGLVVE